MRIDMTGISIEPVKLTWWQIVLLAFSIGGAWYMLLDHDKVIKERSKYIEPMRQVIAQTNRAEVIGERLNNNIVELTLTIRELTTKQTGSEKERTKQAELLRDTAKEVTSLRVKMAEFEARLPK